MDIVRSLSHLLNCAADIHPAQKIFFEDEYKFSETARVHDFQTRAFHSNNLMFVVAALGVLDTTNPGI